MNGKSFRRYLSEYVYVVYTKSKEAELYHDDVIK